MRSLVLIAVFSLAGAAAAQPLVPQPPPGQGLQGAIDLQMRLGALQAQQDLAQRQAVIAEGRTEALAAQAQTERDQADLRARAAAGARWVAPAPGVVDLGPLAAIPDAALADSDAKVRAAANNHR